MNYDLTVFDSDGTLVDSLVAHVRWINDMNSLYDFGQPTISENNISEARKIMRPRLRDTVKSCGFPDEMMEELVTHYNEHFGHDDRYLQHPFPGIKPMLKYLHKKVEGTEAKLGIVSANIIPNIKRGLGNISDFAACIGREKMDEMGWCKADALKSIAKEHSDAKSMVYVGDTIKDFYAASEAEFDFFGVTYGWEIDDLAGRELGFETTGSVSGLCKLIGIPSQDILL